MRYLYLLTLLVLTACSALIDQNSTITIGITARESIDAVNTIHPLNRNLPEHLVLVAKPLSKIKMVATSLKGYEPYVKGCISWVINYFPNRRDEITSKCKSAFSSDINKLFSDIIYWSIDKSAIYHYVTIQTTPSDSIPRLELSFDEGFMGYRFIGKEGERLVPTPPSNSSISEIAAHVVNWLDANPT